MTLTNKNLRLPGLSLPGSLILILAISLILRLAFIFETGSSPFVTNLFSDSEIYNNYADQIISTGNWLGNEAFFMAPVYPYLLAIYKVIFGDSLTIFRIIQTLAGCLTILFIYFSAKNLFNERIAFISAIIASLFDYYIFYSGLIFSETFQILAYSVFVFLITDKTKFESRLHWFWTGIMFGILALFRGNILLFLPVFIIIILIKRLFSDVKTIRRIGIVMIFLSGTGIAILPVTIRNIAVSGDLLLLTSNGGINFYIGNNNDAVGVFVTPSEFNYESDMSGKKYAERILGEKVSASEASSFWYSKTLEEISNEPVKFAELFIKKLLMFFDADDLPQSSILDKKFYSENYSRVLKLPLIGYSVVSILFLLGLILYLYDSNKNYLIIGLIFTYVFATALFFVNGRFRLGITPAMIIIAGYSLSKVYEMFLNKESKDLYVPAIVVLIFVIISYFFIDKPKFTEYDAYLHLGDIAQNSEKYEEAIYYYNRSIVLSPNHRTFMNLGNTFAKKRDFKNALSAFNEAEKRSDNDHLLYFNKGIVFSQIGDYNNAIEAYNKALKLYPDFPPAIRNIGIIYFVNENYEDAKYYFSKFLEISNDEQTKALVRKDLETIERKSGGK